MAALARQRHKAALPRHQPRYTQTGARTDNGFRGAGQRLAAAHLHQFFGAHLRHR